MPIDPNIISSVQAPDFAGAIATGVNMAALAQQRKLQGLELQQKQQAYNEQQAMKNAQNKNTKVNDDGSVQQDANGTMKDLAAAGYAQLVPQYAQEQATRAYTIQKQQLEKQQEQHSYVAQLASGTHDQASWDKALQQAQAAGIPTDQIPKQFDPSIRNSIIHSSLSAKDNLANQIAQQEANTKDVTAKNEQMKLQNELFKTYGAPIKGGKPAASVDPATLVPHVVPPDRQKEVFEEIKNAQNVGTNGPKIMDAFERAANENTFLKTGGGYLRTPGSVMSLHQMMLPNFKSIDGTVRQAAMDESFKNVTPQPGDTDAKIAEKREALKGWLSSEAAAPISKGYGIDLSQYPSTSFQQAMAKGEGGKGGSQKTAQYTPTAAEAAAELARRKQSKSTANR